MKGLRWQILLGAFLLLLSSLLYYLHFLIFGDAHHIFIYLLGDIAFIPVEVLIVTIIIHQLLDARDRRSKMEKLNMIVGVFFSEVGIELVGYFASLDPGIGSIRDRLLLKTDLNKNEFLVLSKHIKHHDFSIDVEKANLALLSGFLKEKRDLMLRLLENPNLLEHESFTSLLWAVFHLAEELSSRKRLADLTQKDMDHLGNDMKRAYSLLVGQWLDYMLHLKDNYPYLFSLALRTNPFDEKASAEIK